MEVVASELGLEAWAESWEVNWDGDQVPRQTACVCLPVHMVGPSVPVKQEGFCLICLAPLFVLTIWWICPPTGTPLKSPSLGKKVSQGALLPHSAGPQNRFLEPICQIWAPSPYFCPWVVWPLSTGNGHNADLRTSIEMYVSFIKYSSRKRTEQHNKKKTTELQFEKLFFRMCFHSFSC